MKPKFFILTALLATSLSSFAAAQAQVDNTELVAVPDEYSHLFEVKTTETTQVNNRVIAVEDAKAIKEVKNVNFEKKEQSLDEIEAEAARLAREAAKLEKKSKELRQKAEKMAAKSEKMEEKSTNFESTSVELSEESKKSIEESEKLAKLIDESPDKANREEAIRKVCEGRAQRKNLLKVFDRRAQEVKIEDCIASYKESNLKKKKSLQKAHLGKQCEINLGISIECPEGTYKFVGNEVLAQIASDDRTESKDIDEVASDSTQGVAAAASSR